MRSTGVAVEKSTFTFITKPDFNIRYKEVNTPGQAGITNGEGGSKVYTWKADGIKAVRFEPYSPDPDLYRISVKIAPGKVLHMGA